jgi:radical SAM PhpK family P-methyltransferase
MTDCLLIGFNDSDFAGYVDLVKGMGERSGAFQDLNLSYIDYEGAPRHSLDMLNRFHFEGRPGPHRRFHNVDFLWPTIVYLGTFLARHGFSFDYVNLFQDQKDELREKLVHGNVRTVAITTTLYVTPHPIIEIVRFVREHNPDVKIVVGGPYIHNQSRMGDYGQLQPLLRYIGADIYVVSQQGESALVNLLAALRDGGSLASVENLAYREGDRYARTGTTREANVLADNMVDWGLFPREDISQFVSLRTAISCPFNCAFCGFPARAGKYQYNSVALIEQELDALAELGTVTTLTFLDDTFNVPKPRFKEILRMMIRKGYGFRWNSFYRSDHGDEEAIELMGRAGCEGVFLGVESGSDAQLQRMNKTSRRHHYLKAVPLFRAAGINTMASLIVGFPGETEETFGETLSFLDEARPDLYRTQLWYCDPMTPIWQDREKYGLRGSGFAWSHATMDYAAACELINETFVTPRESVWCPQNGFEPWSMFYLQRRGMTHAQVKDFLRAFNALVADKLTRPGSPPPQDLLDDLRLRSRFDAVEPAPAPPVAAA